MSPVKQTSLHGWLNLLQARCDNAESVNEPWIVIGTQEVRDVMASLSPELVAALAREGKTDGCAPRVA